MEIVDEVAFCRIHNPISGTHQEIAAELGSSREVISRILENLFGQGIIRVLRGSIDILDAHLLEKQIAR